MGWISDRKMRTGHGLAHGHKRSEKDKAPLKKIVSILAVANSMFERDRVLLECGHTTFSNGIYRARCLKCLKESKNE